MVKPKNAIIAFIVILVCTGAFLLLLANTSIPTFTVKELMDASSDDSYIGRHVQLIGVVNQIDAGGFFLTDPEDTDNSSLVIYVEAINVEKPTGFVIGKTVLVEGELLSTTSSWKFKATLISTKCPSKYQSEDA
ncbi:MAG: hypothetical protein ACXAEU_01965 [Candidatus Hodarchaeales archaeon]|jgi:hypothetical protein